MDKNTRNDIYVTGDPNSEQNNRGKSGKNGRQNGEDKGVR